MFFRRRNREETTEVQGTNSLFLHISEAGWRGRRVNEGQEDLGPIRTGDAPDIAVLGPKRLEAVVRLAAHRYAKRKFEKVGDIYVLLDDPTVAFIDAKDQQFASPSADLLREYGARQLNVGEATYGQRKFGLHRRSEGEGDDGQSELVVAERKRDGVYAFMEVQRLRNMLGDLEDLALRIVSVVPVADVLLSRAEARPSETYTGLYVADHNTYLALANPGLGTAMVRTLPIGLMTIVLKLADEQAVPAAEVLKALGNRDYISGVPITPLAEEASHDAYARILSPLLRRYFAEIEKTIDYFDMQRMSGRASVIEVVGEIERVRGVKEILGRELGAGTEFPEEPLVDMFRKLVVGHAGEGHSVNLLSGAARPLVTVGKKEYLFSNDRFVTNESADLDQGVGQITEEGRAPEAPSSRIEKMRKERTRKERGKGKGGLLGRRTAEPGRRERGRQRPGRQAGEQGDRQIFMLLGLLVFGILYLGWTQFDDVSLRYENRVRDLGTSLKKNAELRRELTRAPATVVRGRTVSDKVLWSEKFLAIADNMDEHLWLTDVYLSDEQRQIGEA